MTTVNSAFLGQLLYRGESETLDFKRDQFPFLNATDGAKSKLLKDVLAFANAWRQETAYILIGVEDVQGAKSKAVGITGHIDDAALQQFVNSKTQQPVVISYQAAVLEGKVLTRDDPDPRVQEFEDKWEVTVEFGDARPHDEVRTTSPLLLGSLTDQRVALVGELRGDNLATPVPCELEVDFSVESREMRKSDARYLPSQ